MEHELTIKTEHIYQGKLVNLRVDTVELPTGNQTEREIVEHGACTAIVAVDSTNNVLLVRQYRKAVERVLLEIPAGNVEDKEEPLECAKRELEEETGYSAGKWEELGYFYTSPGFCTEDMYLYLATELKEAKRKADDDEYIKLEKIPLDRIRGIIDSGEICDAKSIAGLLLMLRNRSI